MSYEHDLSAVMRRIQKLLNIANDGRGSPEEAAAAAQQADNLMRKFQVDNDALVREQMKKDGGVVRMTVFSNMKRGDALRPPLKRVPLWGDHFAHAVSQLNDCETRGGFAINDNGQGRRVLEACNFIYGYAPDVQVACWMFDYIVGEMIQACRAFQMPPIVPPALAKPTPAQKWDRLKLLADVIKWTKPDKAQSHAFRQGFVDNMCRRLGDMTEAKRQEREAAARKGASNIPGTSLVVLKNQLIVKEFGVFTYHETLQQEMSEDKWDAYRAGVQKGERVDLARHAIGDDTTPQVLIAINNQA